MKAFPDKQRLIKLALQKLYKIILLGWNKGALHKNMNVYEKERVPVKEIHI